MTTRRMFLAFTLFGLLFAGSMNVQTTLAAPAADGGTRNIPSGGTTGFHAGGTGSGTLQWPEFFGGGGSSSKAPGKNAAVTSALVNRSNSRNQSGASASAPNGAADSAAAVNSAREDESNPKLKASFDGLYHRQQRLANGGNQFSVEPPDQGLCAGNGFVLESVNTVMRVYDPNGNPLTPVMDLNTFYGYPAQIDRTGSGGGVGPFVTDPSCLFDRDTQRWFQIVLTLDVKPSNGAFLGPNHIDIAVSKTANPTGAWTIYRVPVQDDGTQGTPNHGCSGGPCIGDYPHLGADTYGFYVTTNEYSLFGPEFHGAQIYAFSKQALASGAPSVAVTQLDTAGADKGRPGFTVWPAVSPKGSREEDNRASRGNEDNNRRGTEYFLSSTAADEVLCPSGCVGPRSSDNIVMWTLKNTSSLNKPSPALALSSKELRVNRYSVPPLSNQKAGDFPLGQCLNNDPCATVLLGGPDPYKPEVEMPLDSNDTRMQQVTLVDGKLWGALDTALTLKGVKKAGIEWFAVNSDEGSLAKQGFLGLAGNNLTYPAIGMTAEGKGVMAFTVVGDNYYPSAGYAGIGQDGVGDVHLAAKGLGPEDGFSGYKAEGNPPGTTRPRWGDYGAAVADGNAIWIASEYIGQTCTLAQYEAAPFGSCGGTRTALANWYTRISKVLP